MRLLADGELDVTDIAHRLRRAGLAIARHDGIPASSTGSPGPRWLDLCVAACETAAPDTHRRGRRLMITASVSDSQ